MFDVIRRQRIERENYQADVCITRLCHLVTWRHRSVYLTELVTTLTNHLPQKRRLFACRLRGERTETIQCVPSVVYQTSVTVERLQPEVFGRIQHELECDAVRGGIFHSFQPHHRLTASPISHVTIEAKAKSLLVQSFHTFPDDCTIFQCQSLFEIKPDA